MPVDDGRDAGAGVRLEALGGRQLETRRACVVDDRSGEGMLRPVFRRGCEHEHPLAIDAAHGGDRAHGHVPGRDGAGLVEHDRVDAAGALEHLRAPTEDAQLRAAPRADQQRGRRREAERAGAGDDERRDRRREADLDRVGEHDPRKERDEREQEDDGHEDARDAVGEPLHVGLAGLRFFDEAREARELGVGADARRLDDEPSTDNERAAHDAVVDRDVDGHRFAREQRLVDARGALDDETVGRDGLTGAHDEAVADLERVDGHAHFDAVPQYGRLARGEIEQGVERFA